MEAIVSNLIKISSIYLPVSIIFASSAYSMNFAKFDIQGSSFMLITKRRDPKILPCGTPNLIGFIKKCH